jgi:diamine N-acetyltransferase
VNTGTKVSLQQITSATVRQVTALSVKDAQKTFVAPNSVSLAEALFKKEAWYRAVYADDELAGFVMLFDEGLRDPPTPDPRIALWRFMIDQRFQGCGIGMAALKLVIAHARDAGPYDSLQVTYLPGPGCPGGFYLKAGFLHTGRVDNGEVILELPLRPSSA